MVDSEEHKGAKDILKRQTFSLCDIMKHSDFEEDQKIYEIAEDIQYKFVLIKVRKVIFNDLPCKMIQMNDVTNSVTLQKLKIQNQIADLFC